MPPTETSTTDTPGQANSGGRELGMLLMCFDGNKAASKAHRQLDTQLRSRGDEVLDTVIFRVDAKHRASVYDPRRLLGGMLTPVLTWGAFGLLTGGGIVGAIGSAILGAILGGLYAYLHEHILTKSQLERIGARLPAQSSALLIIAESNDPHGLLEPARQHTSRVCSVAAIADDLSAQVFTAQDESAAQAGGEPGPEATALLSMITVRYADPSTAKQMAAKIDVGSSAASAPQVELVMSADANGHRHVTDPGHGVAAMARSDVISWGAFGLVCGALAGVFGGGGILGLLGGGVLTGIGWGLFGLVAGALYGLWAGQAVSAGRLKRVGRLLAPGTSMLLAWAEGPLNQEGIDKLAAAGSRHLVLCFNPVDGGAVLETA